MKGKITKRTVDATKRSAVGDRYVWDDTLSGFGLRVKPSGAKSYVLSYYAPKLSGVRRRLTIGTYPPMTPDDARGEAERLRGRIAAGEDPAAEEAEEQRAVKEDTVGAIVDAYTKYGEVAFKAKTQESYATLSTRYVIPACDDGKLPLQALTRARVARLHHSLHEKPYVANRTVQYVKALWNWAEGRGLVTGTNPTRGIKLFPEPGREEFLNAEQLAKLGEALRVAETTGLPLAAPELVAKAERQAAKQRSKRRRRERNAGMFTSGAVTPASPIATNAVRFLAMTGWRLKEALTLKWSDLTDDYSIATLADSKTGKTVRVLGAPARAVLSAVPRVEESPWVFPSSDDPKEKPLDSVRRLWCAVRHHAGLPGLRLHDLRHTVASQAVASGTSLFVVSKLLGHKSLRSAERYAHIGDDVRKAAADAVATTIAEAMAPTPTTIKPKAKTRRLEIGHMAATARRPRRKA